jgi:glycosyltransferase involved in cell wall biosynthesis
MKPLITVIVPISKMHGKLRALEEWLQLIDSTAFQVILIHDVQDCETGPELEEILARTKNAKPQLISGHFGSPGAARNEGFQYAKGKWTAFWDSDDQPDCLEFQKMVEEADRQKCKIAIGGFSKTNDRTGFKESTNIPSLDFEGSNLAFEPGIWRWAFLTNNISSIRFTHLRMGEDQVFLSQLDFLESEVYLHKNTVYSYSLNRSGQLTSDKSALSDLISAMKIELEIIEVSKRPMSTFVISLLLKQSMTALKSFKIKLIAQALYLNFEILKDALKNRNSNYLIGIKSLLKFILLKKNEEKLHTIFALGGFGNQLFQVAAGLSISQGSNFYLDYSHGPKYSDKIDLVRDYNLPGRILVSNTIKLGFLRKAIFNRCIRFSSLGNSGKNLKKIKGFGRIWLERLLLVVKVADWRINLGTGFDQTVADSGKHFLLGYFQTFKYFSDQQTKNLLRSIRLKNPSDLFLSNEKEIKELNALIVHVRLGDYLQETRFGQLTPEYFHRVIREIWTSGRFNRICLFSNERNFAIQYVPPELEEKIWSPNIDLTSVAENFELMRYGKGYILSNSSFSWWAASLSHEPSPLIVAPMPWFQPEIDPSDLIPEDWIRVSKLDFENVQIAI